MIAHDIISNLNKSLKDCEVQKWLITSDGVKRQYVKNGKRHWQRLPRNLYAHLEGEGLKDLLSRLNAEDWRIQQALEKYEIQSAFIPPKLLEDFEKQLQRESLPQTARTRLQNLKKYCLEFFLARSPNPVAWQREHQEEWLEYLVSLDYSPSTYKHIRTALNKFMRLLAKKSPDLPILHFDGLSPFQISEIRFRREMRGLGVRHFIPKESFSLIYEHAAPQLKPYCAIAYAYGLRRNEISALTVDKIKNTYLAVDWQRNDDGKKSLPKYRKTRKVPHWMMSPKDLYRHVSSLKPYRSGSDLSLAFTKTVSELYASGLIDTNYVLHDCRHSFVSNAVKSNPLQAVMFAAGHADLRTTSTYLKDTSTFDDDAFDPTGS